MAYLVAKTFNNGYRCCCHNTIDDDGIWFQTEAEALAQLPTTHAGPGDYELERIQIFDGADGSVVAEGQLEWTSPTRGAGYTYQRWFGHVKGVPFEEIKGGLPGESWEELKERLQRQAREESIIRKRIQLAALEDEDE